MIRRPLTSFSLKQSDFEQLDVIMESNKIRASSTTITTKGVDEISSMAPNDWKNAQIADEICPRCSSTKAYFMQLQTRSSADKPMTIFYRCTDSNCGHRWNG